MATIKKPNEYYTQRTAKIARKIGDTILIAGTTMSAVSLDTMPHWVTYLSLGLTMLGKMISNLFTDSTNN